MHTSVAPDDNGRKSDRLLTAAGNSHGIVGWGNETQNGGKWHLRTNDSAINGVVGALRAEVQGGYITASTAINDDQWHLVAFTFEGTNVTHGKLYVDGELEAASSQQAQAVNVQAGTLPLLLAARNQIVLTPLHGLLDEAAIFSYALTGQQIRDLHHLGSGQFHMTAFTY